MISSFFIGVKNAEMETFKSETFGTYFKAGGADRKVSWEWWYMYEET